MPKTKYYFDGKYYQQKVRKSDNPADGYATIRGKTVAELTEKLNDYNFKRKSGMVFTSKPTVAEWIKIWWGNRKFSASVESYRRPMINNVIGPAIGTLKVADIKPEHIQQIMTSVSENSESYNKKLYQLLSRIFKDAQRNGLIMKNPCEDIVIGGVETEEKTAITKEQFQALISAVTGTRAYLFCMIGYYTGMRREEICGLKWDHVFLDSPAPYIKVEFATTWPDRSAGVWPSELKCPKSYRNIPIHSELLPALQSEKATSTSEFVLHGKDGGVMSYMSMRRLWGIVDDRTLPEYLPKSRIREYRTDATGKGKKKPNAPKTIDFAITPHILRHTFATNLVSSGMDIKKVQYLTGHADINVLLKIYAHVRENKPEDLANFINAAM